MDFSGWQGAGRVNSLAIDDECKAARRKKTRCHVALGVGIGMSVFRRADRRPYHESCASSRKLLSGNNCTGLYTVSLPINKGYCDFSGYIFSTTLYVCGGSILPFRYGYCSLGCARLSSNSSSGDKASARKMKPLSP
jgi:hypothetical protein